MTGVSGLNLFLRDGSPSLQNQALQFLVNGLSLETDVQVRGGILDVLADLRSAHLSQGALDEALRTAVERNRSLTKEIVTGWPKGVLKQKKLILAKFKIAGLDLDGNEGEIPAKVIAGLTNEQYLALLDAEHGPFQALNPAQEVPLTSLSKAIETLVALGATVSDFEGMYCEKCDFSKATRPLDGAIFDQAYLARADFAHVSLQGASFRYADIAGTNFFGADLTKANLKSQERKLAGKGLRYLFPMLECAKLRGADLTGLPLVFFHKSFSTTSSSGLEFDINVPRMASVQLDESTKLDAFTITVGFEITDDYLKHHPTAPAVEPLTKDRSGLWEMPLFESAEARGDFQRFHATFAEDASKYTDTTGLMDWSLAVDDLKSLGGDAFMLRGYVDQPALKMLPLYSQFVDAVRALPVPNTRVGKVAQAWSDKAANAWETLKPVSCSEHPRGFSKMTVFNLGTHDSTSGPDND